MSDTTDDWQATADPAPSASPAPPADDWQPTIGAGQHDYTQMGTLGRLGDQLQSGWEGLKQGINTLGLAGAVHRLQNPDEGAYQTDTMGAPLFAPQPSPDDKERLRQENVAEVGSRAASIIDSQRRQRQLAVNPAFEQMSSDINAGHYGKAAGQFVSDPLGVLQQATVQGLPASAPMLAAGAVGGLAAGPIGAAIATGAGAYGTDVGPRVLGYLEDGLRRAGVDTNDAAAVSAAIQAHPEIVNDAVARGGRASLGPAIINAALGSLTRGFLPGRGTGYNVGVAAGNAGIHVAGQPAAEASGQLLGEGTVNDPAAVVNAGLGSLPQTLFHTGQSTIREAMGGTFRPGSRGLGSVGAEPEGGPGAGGPGAAGDTSPWRLILGFPQTIEQAEENYRTLARSAHPDLGGSHEEMAALNRAIEEARTALTPRPAAAPEPEQPAAPAEEPTAATAAPVVDDWQTAPEPAPVRDKRAELEDILNDPRPTSVIQAEMEAGQAGTSPAEAPVATGPVPPPQAGEPPATDLGHRRAAAVAGWVDTLRRGQGMPISTEAERIALRTAAGQIELSQGKDGGATAEQAAWARQIINETVDAAGALGTRGSPIILGGPEDITRAAANVAQPTEGQAAAGNYQKGHVKIGGLDVAIENPMGSTRTGTDPNGKAWSVQMPADYGYVKRTSGADGDQVDVYLGPQAHEAPKMPVFIVDQIGLHDRQFDEHKAMLGFPTEGAARAAYSAAFSDGYGGHRAGAVTQVSWPVFRQWLRSGDTGKPYKWVNPLIPKPKRQWTANRPATLAEFLAVHGGLAPDSGGELQAMDAHKRFVPGFGPLVRRNGGMTLDHARELAQQGGYLPRDGEGESKVGINEFLDRLAQDLGRTGPRVTADQDLEEVLEQERAKAADVDRDRFEQARTEVLERAAQYDFRLSDQASEWAAMAVMNGSPHEDAIYDGLMSDAARLDAELAEFAKARGDAGWDVAYSDQWTEQDYLSLRDAAIELDRQLGEVKEAGPNEQSGRHGAGGRAAVEGEQPARVEPGPAGPGPVSSERPGAGVPHAVDATGGEGAADVPGAGQAGGQRGERAEPGGGEGQPGAEGAPDQGSAELEPVGKRPVVAGAENPAGVGDYGTVEAPDVSKLSLAFSAHFIGGKSFASIVQARQMASKLLGGQVAPGTMAAKLVDEAVEAGVIRAARSIVMRGANRRERPGAIFQALVDLYRRQPTLGTRTSDSIERQAYSTPAPLGYLADVLAKIDHTSKVYEPTAGNGALLLRANPPNVVANEIDPTRRAALDMFGFPTSDKNAAHENPAGSRTMDAVIANPPFGITKDAEGRTEHYDLDFIQRGYTTGEIDHAIALRSLEAMKDDGRAVLILGGINKQVRSDQGRADAYNGKAKREFFFTLYGKYGVVDHFTVPGELYAKQGAGWPVDVIVIAGRGKSALPLPSIKPPRIVPTWDALKEELGNADTLANPRQPAGVGSAGQPAGERGPVEAGRPQGRSDEGPLPATDVRPGGVDDTGGGGPEAGNGGAGGRDGGGRGVVGAAEVPEPIRGGGGSDGGEPGVRGSAQPGGGTAGREPVPGAPDATGDRGGAGDEPRGVVEPGVPGGERERDPVAAAFDEAFADVFGDEAPSAGLPTSASTKVSVRSSGEAAASATVNTAKAAAEAMAALTELFGNKDRLGSGPSFDEETWARAKPLFQKAIEHFRAAGRDIADMLRALMRELRSAYRWTADMVQRARPYLERFAREWGTESEPEEITEKPNETGEKGSESAGKEISARPVDPQDQAPTRPKEQETATQVAYEPASKVQSVGTLVPTNMRTAVAEALSTLEGNVGPIDAYVARKLGYGEGELGRYFSAEQVDALGLGIQQIDAGKGFIIGDQTGVGKGRFVAGLIRYAMREGLVPVFVTEKPNLYGDILRDLTDIGMPDMADKVLLTNSDLSLPLSDDPRGPRLKTPKPTEHDKALSAAAASGQLPDKYKAIFTTYSQMQQIKGADTARQRMLANVAPNAFVILDEAHNAGGSPVKEDERKPTKAKPGKPEPIPRSVFFRQIVARAKSVAYSSATWAKRPDVLDLYGAKTDMREAVPSLDKLAAAISAGGVPMQQIVTAQLAAVGQYTRRERSFAGISYELHEIETDREAYDKIADVLARIYKISAEHAKAAVKDIDGEIRDTAGAIGGDTAVGNAGATSTGFSSIMHNLINQMLLASKTKGTVDEAISALKRGEKPVIALANTMGSFIKEYAEMTDAQPGDPIDLTFNNLLDRYLKRTLRYTVRKPFMGQGEKAEVNWLTVEQLGREGARLYRETEAIIKALDLANMPVSPIDYMRAELTRAGYKVGEITGREEAADYRNDGKVYYRKRPGNETSIAGRMKAIRGFNSGDIDAMILNQSGATGLSLHASEKVKDQRKRLMLIAQAEANIDTHMQMLGRVNRTGQVVLPGYKQLVANVPAEQRPAAVLANKMASLSASTTANRKAGIGAANTPDFINKYGGQIIDQLLNEHPEIDEKLGRPRGDVEGAEDDEGGRGAAGMDMETLAKKATGRIPLLPLREQEEFYNEIEERYRRLIQELDEAGENGLEAKTLDLDARTLETTELTEGRGNNPFTAASRVEKVSIKRTFTPPNPGRVVADVARGLDVAGHDPEAEIAPDAAAEELGALQDEHGLDHVEQAARDVDSAVRNSIAGSKVKDPDKKAAQQIKIEQAGSRIKDALKSAEPGSLVTIQSPGDLFPEHALVLAIKQTGKNAAAPSSWDLDLLSESGMRRRVGVANLFTPENQPASEQPEGMQIIKPASEADQPMSLQDFLAGIVEAGGQAREERHIVTGNILAGYAAVHSQGQIINYSDHTGATRQGILMPKKFDPRNALAAQAARFSPENAVEWLRHGGSKDLPAEVHTPGDEIRVARDSMGGFTVSTKASKAEGGAYFLDRGIRDRLMADFVKKGDRMQAKAGLNLPALLEAIGKVAAREGHNLISDHPEAKQFAADLKAAKETTYDVAPKGWGDTGAGTDLPAAPTGDERSAIVEAVQKIVGPEVKLEVVEGEMFATMPGSGERKRIGGFALGRLIQVAGASPFLGKHLNHEAIHALRNLGVISPGEWKALEAAAVREGWLEEDAHRSGNYRDDQKLEEAIAERFAKWATNEKPPAGMLGRIWNRVLRFFEALRNALAGRAPRSAEGLFEDIKAGRMGEREPGSRNRTMRHGNESPEQAKTRVLDELVSRGIIEREFRSPVADFMASIERERDASAAEPETLVRRLKLKVADAPVIGRAALALATHMTDFGHTVQMMLSPMAHGGATDQARAVTKDFGNTRRLIRWATNRTIEELGRDFTVDQLTRMWNAADKESVARQTGSTTRDGLNTLEPDERAAVERYQGIAAKWYEIARKVGIHSNENPLPSYVPRMVVDIAMQAEGKTAHIVRDFRTLPLAIGKLQEAVIGRQLIEQIRGMGKASGSATVWEGSAGPPRALDPFTGIRTTTPQMRHRKWLHAEETEEAAAKRVKGDDGFNWFTIPQSPAFWTARFKARDEDGNPIFERIPIFVRGDFEGPLRAVLRKPDGKLYRGAMDLKGRMMTSIMYGVAHLGVIGSRAVEYSPNVIGTLREGRAFRDDVAGMRRAISNGLAPIGRRGGFQDAESIERAQDPTPGRSWTANILAAGPGLVSRGAGDAVKRGVDRAGDLTHGWMWEQVGNIQAGVFAKIERRLIAKGEEPDVAAKIAAHAANRVAGSLPDEAMSREAAKVANIMLFSRSYRLGNLAILKDAWNGLPRDVRAQIERDHGRDVLTRAVSQSQRVARAAVIASLGLYYAGGSLLQSGLAVATGHHTAAQEAKGYGRRALAELEHLKDWYGIPALNPFSVLHSLTPLADNEPDKQSRILYGFDKDGTGLYLRNIFGKVGEDTSDYFTRPIQVLHSMMSPYSHAVDGLWSNRDAFGRHIYDPFVNTPAKFVRAVGDYAAYVLEGAAPSTAIKSATALATGTSDKPGMDAAKIAAGGVGFSLSRGYPGGPMQGEMHQARLEHDYEVERALPRVRELARHGKQADAVKILRELKVPQGLMRYYLQKAANPKASPDQVRRALDMATPEQRERIMRGLQEERRP